MFLQMKITGSLVEGNLVLNEETPKGPTRRTFQITEDGLTIILTALEKDVTARRMFKRI